MERDELGAWLRLSLTPGVGLAGARRLLAAFGSPEAIFAQSQPALRSVVSVSQAEALLRPSGDEPGGWAELLARSWAWLQEPLPHEQRAIVALGEPAYPGALLNIEDPPLLLHLRGQLDGLQDGSLWTGQLAEGRCLAMVGSRNPTPQGALNARQFARSLAQAGLTIVSGLALGVDGAAHEGALEACSQPEKESGVERLATVAVVGTGLDTVYPKRHAGLADRIVRQGVVLSEYPLGTPPLAENFPRRNRLIAGLSCATLVVEAAPQSGSLITARLAVEQGKEVLAIPGSIHSTQARGCHALIRQGARLVESAQDVLEELPAWADTGIAAAVRAQARTKAVPSNTESVRQSERTQVPEPLLEALGADPVSLDALQARTGWSTARLQARLMALELDGEVARLPGGLLQRLVRT